MQNREPRRTACATWAAVDPSRRNDHRVGAGEDAAATFSRGRELCLGDTGELRVYRMNRVKLFGRSGFDALAHHRQLTCFGRHEIETDACGIDEYVCHPTPRHVHRHRAESWYVDLSVEVVDERRLVDQPHAGHLAVVALAFQCDQAG